MVMSRIFRHFFLFVALSLLLHLGVFFYFATRGKEATAPAPTPAPLFVDLREAELIPLDLDVPLRQSTTPRTQPARRLGKNEQVVEREQAPKGSDTRDSTIVSPVQKFPESTASEQQESTVTAPPAVSESGDIPSREKLLAAAKNAAQSVADLDPEVNRKIRRDVEEGRAVWLDTKKEILGSFMKRFDAAIDDVWDYPKEAIARGEFGVCLYRIEINRAGVLVKEPELLKSSGSALLDAEAKRAIIQGAPRFGFLPDAYRYETLTIFAYFDYRLGNQRTIYGESSCR